MYRGDGTHFDSLNLRSMRAMACHWPDEGHERQTRRLGDERFGLARRHFVFPSRLEKDGETRLPGSTKLPFEGEIRLVL